MSLQVGEYGIDFELSVGQSLAGMVSALFKVKKPDGTEDDWEASVSGDETDGILTYEIQDGDLDQAGMYKVHAYVVFTGSKPLIGDKAEFEVKALFNDD